MSSQIRVIHYVLEITKVKRNLQYEIKAQCFYRQLNSHAF